MTDTPDLAAQVEKLREIVGRMTPGDFFSDGYLVGQRDSGILICEANKHRDATGFVALRNTTLPIMDAQAAENARLREALWHICALCPQETGHMSTAALAGLFYKIETRAADALKVQP
jgi:hypothetical protein